MGVVDGSMKEWSMKDVVLMLSIVGLLTDQLEQESHEVRVATVMCVCVCVYVSGDGSKANLSRVSFMREIEPDS